MGLRDDPLLDEAQSGQVGDRSTVVSRTLGFVRTSVWAWALGLQIVSSTFLVANTVANVVYTLLAGGVLNTTLVPLLVGALGTQGERAYTDRLLTAALLLLGGATIAAVIATPLLAAAYAGDNWSRADVALTTAFAFWCLPQIFFYGVYSLLGQVLTVRGSFAPMMWAPVANNIVAIVLGLLFVAAGSVDRGAGPGASESLSNFEIGMLGGGATLGVVVQAFVLLPALRRAGFRYRPRWDLRRAGLGEAGRMASWTVLYVLINQVTFWVVTRAANTAGTAGAEAAGHAVGMPSYSNAYLLMLLSHGVVTVSVTTALLPRMSASAAANDRGRLRADLLRGLSIVAVVTVPAAVLFAALGPLIGRVAFFGNTTADAQQIGVVLMAFAPGLVAFSAQYVVLRTFYARRDTRTPTLIQLAVASVNIGLVLLAALLLPPEHVVVGIAAAYSLACFVGLVMGVTALRRLLGGTVLGQIVAVHGRILAAAAPAGVVTVAVRRWGTDVVAPGLLGQSAVLLVAGFTAVVVFGLLAHRAAASEVRLLTGAFTRVRRSSPQGA